MVMNGLITSFSKNRLGVFRSKNASISVSIVSVNWHSIICFKKLVLLLLLSNKIIIVFENIGNLLRMENRHELILIAVVKNHLLFISFGKVSSDIIYDTQINYAEIVSVFAVSSKHVISFFSKSVPSTSEE